MEKRDIAVFRHVSFWALPSALICLAAIGYTFITELQESDVRSAYWWSVGQCPGQLVFTIVLFILSYPTLPLWGRLLARLAKTLSRLLERILLCDFDL